eukprot:357431-Chlamydomonas_euryale.AAC.4
MAVGGSYRPSYAWPRVCYGTSHVLPALMHILLQCGLSPTAACTHTHGRTTGRARGAARATKPNTVQTSPDPQYGWATPWRQLPSGDQPRAPATAPETVTLAFPKATTSPSYAVDKKYCKECPFKRARTGSTAFPGPGLHTRKGCTT